MKTPCCNRTVPAPTTKSPTKPTFRKCPKCGLEWRFMPANRGGAVECITDIAAGRPSR